MKAAAVLRRDLEARGLMPLVRSVLEAHPFVHLDEVLGDSRLRPIAEARAHLAYELYEVLRSFPMVGLLLGRDHTTIMEARRRWAEIVGDVGPLPAKAPVQVQQPYRHPSTVYTGGAS